MSLTDQLAFFEMEADALKKVTLSASLERAGRHNIDFRTAYRYEIIFYVRLIVSTRHLRSASP